jgi:hypothetical protein
MTIRAKESAEWSKALLEDVSCKHLIHILNYVNFKRGCVVVNLKNLENGNRLSLRATPEPCANDTARLAWSETVPANMDATTYELVDFLIDRGSRVVIVGGQAMDMNASGTTVVLPERSHTTSRRQTERFSSALVHATLCRNESEATGLLQDFGGGCLKVRFTANKAGFILKQRGKSPLHIVLKSAETTVYNGKGTIKRRITNGENIDFVVALTAINDEKPSGGQEVTLGRDLVATCRHPLSDRIIRLSLAKASYNSFIVSEYPEHVTLFPGLIIPEMRIDFGAGDYAECTAQVMSGEAGTWRVSILDMPIVSQRKLFSFIEKETGMRSGVSAAIDPEDLVEFFFEAGFMYPKKYASVANSREHLKEILSRLYIDTPSVAQHFVQYNRGIMEAHIAMVRFYERSWVVHHHTAIGGAGAGSTVLSQIFRYIHSYGALPSTGMTYLMTYYRPENRFPDRVLGGFSRFLDKPRLCSVDSFAYLHLHFDGSGRRTHDDREWQLEPANHEDLLELEAFYDGVSGGLSVKAFGLEPTRRDLEMIDLDAEFAKAGLRRRKSFFSLKRRGRLKAVMMALDSDSGLNMSNLMKCIHIFVIDREGLPFDQLVNQLNELSFLYEEREIPILLFPSSYVSDQGVVPEKVYDLLIFDASIVKQFIQFVERLTNRAVRRRYGVVTPGQEGDTSEKCQQGTIPNGARGGIPPSGTENKARDC